MIYQYPYSCELFNWVYQTVGVPQSNFFLGLDAFFVFTVLALVPFLLALVLFKIWPAPRPKWPALNKLQFQAWIMSMQEE